MEKKIVKKSIKITTDSTQDVEVFIAKDGKEFTNERDCKNHEHYLELTEKVKLVSGFNEVNFTSEEGLKSLLYSLQIGCGDMSNVFIFSFTPTKNIKEEFEIISTYLRNRFYKIQLHDGVIEKFKVGEKTFIVYWIEGDNSDYPTVNTNILTETETKKIYFEQHDEVMNKLFNL